MALKKCRECGTEVSTEATQCPHCGVKDPTSSPGATLVKRVFVGAVAFGVSFFVWSAFTGEDATQPPPPPAVQAQQDATRAHVVLSDVHPATEDGMPVITGYATNQGTSPLGYVMISFNLFNAHGDQVGTADDSTSNLAAGARWRFKAIVTNDSARKFKLAQISAF